MYFLLHQTTSSNIGNTEAARTNLSAHICFTRSFSFQLSFELSNVTKASLILPFLVVYLYKFSDFFLLFFFYNDIYFLQFCRCHVSLEILPFFEDVTKTVCSSEDSVYDIMKYFFSFSLTFFIFVPPALFPSDTPHVPTYFKRKRAGNRSCIFRPHPWPKSAVM